MITGSWVCQMHRTWPGHFLKLCSLSSCMSGMTSVPSVVHLIGCGQTGIHNLRHARTAAIIFTMQSTMTRTLPREGNIFIMPTQRGSFCLGQRMPRGFSTVCRRFLTEISFIRMLSRSTGSTLHACRCPLTTYTLQDVWAHSRDIASGHLVARL